MHVGQKMPIPNWLIKPFVKLGPKIYGGFDVDEVDAYEAVENAKVPILIIHGEADTFVPCEMSDVTSGNAELISRHTFPNANHGLSYLEDTPRYQKIVADFMDQVLN